MKQFLLTLLGTVLLAQDGLAVSLEDFRDDVFRPDNLPGAAVTDAPVEVKISGLVEQVINVILYVSGSVAVIFLVYGAIRYIISLGRQEEMDKAKQVIQRALIGLLAVIFAFAVVSNVINLIIRATT